MIRRTKPKVASVANTTMSIHVRAARDFGSWYRRQRASLEFTGAYTVTRFPQFAGFEADIRRDWNAERSGR